MKRRKRTRKKEKKEDEEEKKEKKGVIDGRNLDFHHHCLVLNNLSSLPSLGPLGASQG
jgi:hypothetical protein